MGYELGGSGWLGVAVEATYGTWVTPTKWLPIRSESLQKVEDKIYRTNIRGLADRSGAIQGFYHIEGDVEFEVSADILLYFIYGARITPSRTGAGPYVYTFVPAHVASPSTASGVTNRKSLSVTVMRNNRGFGYYGMSITRMAFRVENGLLLCTATLMGLDEAQQAGPFTPVYPTTTPFGPLYNSLEIPNASVRTDIDAFTLDIDDGGEAQNRIKTTGGRAPSFIKWGEREVTMSADIDFDALTDYNAFLNQTMQVLKFTAEENATTNKVTITLNATVADSYQVNLSGLGDLVRASVAFHGVYNTSDTYSIVINTAETMT